MRGPQRHLLSGAAVAAIVAAGLAGCGETPVEEGFEGGPAEGDGYELVLPDGWGELTDDARGQAEEGTRGELEEDLGFDPSFSIDAAFGKEREDDFSTNVNIVIEPLPPSATLDQYEQVSVTTTEQIGVEVLEGPSPATLGSEPAFELRVAQEAEGRELVSESVSTIGPDGSAYTITLTDLAERVDESEPEFAEIVESFAFTGP